MPKMLSEREFNIIKAKISNLTTPSNTLNAFAEVFQPMILFMKNEIEVDPNKQIYDLVILSDNNKLIIKGKIPEKYSLYELAVTIIYTLSMYINKQFTRGKDKNPVLWIKSAHILNNDIYDTLPYFLDEYIRKEQEIINNYKQNKSSNYKYDEEINYKILYQHIQQNILSNTKSTNNIQQMIQDAIDSLLKETNSNQQQNQNNNRNNNSQDNESNSNSSCKLNTENSYSTNKIKNSMSSPIDNSNTNSNDDMLQTIMNLSKVAQKIEDMTLTKQDIKDLEDSYNNIKDKISDETRNKLKDILDDIKNLPGDYSYFNENDNQIEWSKHLKENSKQLENTTGLVQDLIRQNFDKLRGKLSNSIVEILENILQLKLPWQEILRHALTTYFDKASSRRWNYPNVYYRRVGYFPSEDYDEKIDNITLFVDTSGSMTTEELKYIFGIVKDIMDNVEIKSLTIIQHSYDLEHYQTYELDDLNEDIIKNIKIHGRGGTSHIVPFEKYYQLIELEEVPYPDLILFCSDFVSDFNELFQNEIFDEFKDRYFAVTTYSTDLPEHNKVIKIATNERKWQ